MRDITRSSLAAGSGKLAMIAMRAVMAYYDLGVIVDTVYNSDDIPENERDSELEELAAGWGFDGGLSAALAMRRVAVQFKRSDVSKQARLPMANGNYLCWGHFEVLALLRGEKLRMVWFAKLRRNNWTPAELKRRVQNKITEEVF